MRLAVTIEGHPVPQGSLSHGRGGRAYWPKRVQVWRTHVANTVRREMQACGLPLFAGRTAVSLRFYVKPTQTGRLIGDIDKTTRAILDACTGIVWADDEVVTTLLASKQPVEPDCVERCEMIAYLPTR